MLFDLPATHFSVVKVCNSHREMVPGFHALRIVKFSSMLHTKKQISLHHSKFFQSPAHCHTLGLDRTVGIFQTWKRLSEDSMQVSCMSSCKVFKTITDPYPPTLSIWKLSKTLHFSSPHSLYDEVHALPFMHKNKTCCSFVGRNPLLANGGILRCEPVEHMLPIIRRPRRYAQLAGWLVNPRRYIYFTLVIHDEYNVTI
jgi:hypothetical protein